MYTSIKLRKVNNKFRDINIPDPETKVKLKKIHKRIYNSISIKENIFSFRSVLNTINYHFPFEYDYWIELDIKKFFPSIIKENFVRLYPNLLTNEELDICFYQNSLPQGSPASPILAECFIQYLERSLYETHQDFVWSRYVDNIIISCRRDNIPNVIRLFKNIYSIGNLKCPVKSIIPKTEKFGVLGITVQNNIISLSRRTKRKLSLKLVNSNQESYSLGILNYIQQINQEDLDHIQNNLNKFRRNNGNH